MSALSVWFLLVFLPNLGKPLFIILALCFIGVIVGLINNIGVNSSRAKLTEGDVQWIRANYRDYTLKELSLKFDISFQGISRVILRKTYTNI